MKDWIDLFGENLKLNYDGKFLFTTNLSAIISVFYYLGIALYFFLNLYNMTEHSALNLNNYETIMSTEDPLYKLNESNFFLAFELNNGNGDNIFTVNSNISKYFKFNSHYQSVYGNSILYNTLNISRCNSTSYKLLPNISGLLCLDFNNSGMGGNVYSYDNKNLVDISLSFDYSKFEKNFNSSKKINELFPLFLNVYSPITSLNLMNYTNPYSKGIGFHSFRLKFNITKYIQMSANVFEINTDSSFLGKSYDTVKVFTSNNRIYSEESHDGPTSPLVFYFYLDPNKNLYFRHYMKLQDVLNNVSSVSSFLLIILGYFCRKYNQYMLKVDFIEENIMYRIDKEQQENNIVIINNDEPILVTIFPEDTQNKGNLIKLRAKFDLRPFKTIIMKSYFECVFCCKREKTLKKLQFSNDATDFYREYIDIKKFILMLFQFEDLKNIWLSENQKIIFNKSKIILDKKEMIKIKNELNFQDNFLKLKRKIVEDKFDKIDLMIIRKF